MHWLAIAMHFHAGSTDVPLRKARNSGYEFFAPPVTIAMFKELKAEVTTLTKDFQDLLQQEEDKMKELKSSSELALKRIMELENHWRDENVARISGDSKAVEEPTLSHLEKNRQFLQTLSCAQVYHMIPSIIM